MAENRMDSIDKKTDQIAQEIIQKSEELTTLPLKEKIISMGSGSENQQSINIINTFSRNRRMNFMVIGAALGLVFCLLMLTSYKNDLPGEIVGIVSTIAGIFGACLKDAYSFEFESSRKRENTPTPSEKRKY